MKLGLHISTSLWARPSEKKKHGMKLKGRLDECFDIAVWAKCDCFQVFTKSPRQWAYNPLKESVINTFRSRSEELGIDPVFSHLFYLPNFATPDDGLYRRSIRSLVSEMDRCTTLGIDYIVLHVGHHRGAGKEFGIQRCAGALNEALVSDTSVTILLENTTGSGERLGSLFDDLQSIREKVMDPERVKICFDTCHAFSSGYDLRDQKSVEKTLRELDKTIGIQNVYLIHANDSKFPLGSGKDRHEAIGKGEIGQRGFSSPPQNPLVQKIPFVLETPAQSIDDDLANLSTLRASFT